MEDVINSIRIDPHQNVMIFLSLSRHKILNE